MWNDFEIPFLSLLPQTLVVPYRGRKMSTNFFAQVFWTPPGVRDIPAKFPGYSRCLPSNPWKTNFRGRARTFRPPPLHVQDPHPTWWYPDPKVNLYALVSCLTLTKKAMSFSRDGPGVTAPLRTNIVPLTAVWNPPPTPFRYPPPP